MCDVEEKLSLVQRKSEERTPNVTTWSCWLRAKVFLVGWSRQQTWNSDRRNLFVGTWVLFLFFLLWSMLMVGISFGRSLKGRATLFSTWRLTESEGGESAW